MSELLPCPFCGGNPTLDETQPGWVFCVPCDIDQPSHDAWNRRTPPEAHAEAGELSEERGMNWKEKAYATLANYGVPYERAKSIANGIRVLATRYEKQITDLSRPARPAPTANTEGLRDLIGDALRKRSIPFATVIASEIIDALRASHSAPSEGVRKALEKIVVRMNIVTARWRHQKAVNKGEMDALCNMQIDAENALRTPEPPQGEAALRGEGA